MFREARQKLEAMGLWRAFNDTLEFREALLEYIKNQYA